MSDFFLIFGGIFLCLIPVLLIILIVQAIRKKAIKTWIIACIFFFVLFLTFEILGITLSCKHNYIVTEEITATCTSKGTITSYCDLCGKQKTTKTKKIQHNMVETSRTDATFSKDGSIAKKCEFCGKEETSAIPKLKCSHEWQDATCLTAKICSICKEEKGKALDHSWSEATCECAKKCKRCELTEGLPLEHNWLGGTCTKDAKCANCNAVQKAKGHQWIDASCSFSKHCEICSAVEGLPLEHNWSIGSCTEDSKCLNCDAIQKAQGHQWIAASCSSSKHCEICGTVEGLPLEHNWSIGSCTEDSKCSNCDAIQKAQGHQWIEASCTQPKTCKICNTVVSIALGHSWIENTEKAVKICERCDIVEKLISSNPPSEIINSDAKTSDIKVRFETDYIDEDRLHITVFTKNNSDETFIGDIYVALYSADGKRLLGSDVIIIDELLPGRESWAKIVVDAYLGIPRMEIDFWNVTFRPIEKITAEIDDEATKATKDSYYWGFYDVSWYKDITDIVVYTDGNCVVTVKSSTKNEGQFYAATIWGCGNEHGVKSVQVINPEGTVLAVYP